MVNVIQPKVDPLPTSIDLTGQIIVITGASAGMGLETAKPVLKLRASTVILAVRNVAKGEACANSLCQDRRIQAHNPKLTIKVIELDVDRYDSVQIFTKKLQEVIPVINILILNADIGLLKLERSPSGHDCTTQVNYYSNMLSIAKLLPYLKHSAEKTGSPARISWVGSRAHEVTSLKKKCPIKSDECVLEHIDKDKAFVPFQRYRDSKLLCVLFIYSLAPRLDPKKIIINMMCPGMVNTNISDVLLMHLRMIVNIIRSFHARSIEVSGWIILHTTLVVGPESYGRILEDKTIATHQAPFIQSLAGQEI